MKLKSKSLKPFKLTFFLQEAWAKKLDQETNEKEQILAEARETYENSKAEFELIKAEINESF